MIKSEENAFHLIDRLKNYWSDFSENNRNYKLSSLIKELSNIKKQQLKTIT